MSLSKYRKDQEYCKEGLRLLTLLATQFGRTGNSNEDMNEAQVRSLHLLKALWYFVLYHAFRSFCSWSPSLSIKLNRLVGFVTISLMVRLRWGHGVNLKWIDVYTCQKWLTSINISYQTQNIHVASFISPLEWLCGGWNSEKHRCVFIIAVNSLTKMHMEYLLRKTYNRGYFTSCIASTLLLCLTFLDHKMPCLHTCLVIKFNRIQFFFILYSCISNRENFSYCQYLEGSQMQTAPSWNNSMLFAVFIVQESERVLLLCVSSSSNCKVYGYVYSGMNFA